MGDREKIIVGNKEGLIQDIGGRRKFCLPYTKKGIPSYILKVLKEGSCNGILKIDFVEKDGCIWFYYDFSGYVQLEKIIFQWIEREKCLTKELLHCLSKVADCLLNAENHLIPLKELSLDLDTIFVNPVTSEVKIAYIPGEIQDLTMQERIINLISKTNAVVDDEEWNAYSGIVKEKICLNNFGLIDIRKFLSEKLREVYNNDWPVKKLEREEIIEELFIKEEKNSILKKIFSFQI